MDVQNHPLESKSSAHAGQGYNSLYKILLKIQTRHFLFNQPTFFQTCNA